MFIQLAAQNLQTVIDPEQDLIGFDPRGIGATTPRLDCFSPPLTNLSGQDPYDFGTTDVSEGLWKRVVWDMLGREAGIVNTTTASLSQLNTRVKGVTSLCHEKDEVNADNGIFRHVTTPNVARDMIRIIDAWDEWRALTLPSSVSSEEVPAKTDNLGYQLETKGKLMYWGFSYGVSICNDVIEPTNRLIDSSWCHLRSTVSGSRWSSNSRWRYRRGSLR